MEPDSTIEIVEPLVLTPLVEARLYLEEQQRVTQNMLAQCAYNRNLMQEEFRQAQAELFQVRDRMRELHQMRVTANERKRQVQDAIATATAKCEEMRQELQRQKQRVPPTVAMQPREIMALQDRVKRLREMIQYHKRQKGQT